MANPVRDHVSTSYVERNNGIIHQHVKRYARLTQAFSKRVESHMYALALHTMYHNFVRISGAGLRESHVHDVMITREAPNYAIE